jgi:hypothetical protein
MLSRAGAVLRKVIVFIPLFSLDSVAIARYRFHTHLWKQAGVHLPFGYPAAVALAEKVKDGAGRRWGLNADDFSASC